MLQNERSPFIVANVLVRIQKSNEYHKTSNISYKGLYLTQCDNTLTSHNNLVLYLMHLLGSKQYSIGTM